MEETSFLNSHMRRDPDPKHLFCVPRIPNELALRIPKPFSVLPCTAGFASWKWHLVLASLCCNDPPWQGFSRRGWGGEQSWLQAKSQLLNFMLVNSCFCLHCRTNVPYKYSLGLYTPPRSCCLIHQYSQNRSRCCQLRSTCFFRVSIVKRPLSNLIKEGNILYYLISNSWSSEFFHDDPHNWPYLLYGDLPFTPSPLLFPLHLFFSPRMILVLGTQSAALLQAMLCEVTSNGIGNDSPAFNPRTQKIEWKSRVWKVWGRTAPSYLPIYRMKKGGGAATWSFPSKSCISGSSTKDISRGAYTM